MAWKCEETEREIKLFWDDGFIAEMEARGEKLGDQYQVMAELYKKHARLSVVEKDGRGTLIETETGRVIAQDEPGKYANFRPHIGHELYMSDFCAGELIFVECVPCRTMIYDCPWNE